MTFDNIEIGNFAIDNLGFDNLEFDEIGLHANLHVRYINRFMLSQINLRKFFSSLENVYSEENVIGLIKVIS